MQRREDAKKKKSSKRKAKKSDIKLRGIVNFLLKGGSSADQGEEVD